jgi:hypothetical protein
VRVAKHRAHGVVFHALWAALAGLLDRMASRRTGLPSLRRHSRLDAVAGGMRPRVGRRVLGLRLAALVVLGPVDGALLDGAADFALGAAALSARVQRPTGSVLVQAKNKKVKISAGFVSR